MNTNIARHTFASVLAGLFLSALATGRGQNTIYVWSSLDGNPDGISGTIILSSPAYSGDFDPSRIVSVTLSSTVSGTYNVTLPTDIYGRGLVMTWEPTHISEMILCVSMGQPNPSWILVADENNLYGLNPYCPAKIREYCQGPLIAGDDSGAWLAYVPEPASIWLFASAVVFASLYCLSRTGSKRFQPRRLFADRLVFCG